MKKYILFLLAVGLACGTMAQTRLLSSKQLMDRSLYPSRPMSGFRFEQDNRIVYTQDGNAYAVTFSKGKLGTPVAYVDDSKGEPSARTNTARISGSNLYVSFGDKEWSSVGLNTKPGLVFGQSVHRNEFGINGGIFWSPNRNKLAFYMMDESMVAEYPMVKTLKDGMAKPQPFRYPMAGEKSHEVQVGILTADLKPLFLQTRKDNSVEERENYLTNLTWSPDENYLYIAKVNRGQNHMWLERYDVNTGKLDKVLFEESNSRYVEPCEGLYFLPRNPKKKPAQPDQFLWFSMRDGYKHLYLYNADGQLLRQVTSGPYEVEEFLGFDAKGENIFVYANKDNLAGRAAYKVNLKSGQMTRLTDARGYHTVTINEAGTLLIDEYSSVDIPRRGVVTDIATGKSVELYTAPNPMAEYAMPGIELGTIKAADGKTDLYYRLITPPNMEPGKKYPTLVYVYGGPHSQLVTDKWLADANLYFCFLAQQGYVVYTLDNRGTDNRGFEFESCTHRQLGTIEMADQMEGVRFLRGLPYVDKDRMGVEGWSFGGFMTITMKLAHPEIFKVGCAGGPVIDWSWYEVMYGERYMDMPQENPEGYRNNRLIDKAKDLEGRLLVIHGAEDNTVVWQNSIEFVEACINAGRQVDYFIYPHHEHNVRGAERVHLYEKMFDYYETHLK